MTVTLAGGRRGAASPDARPLVRLAGWGRSRVWPLLFPAERDTFGQLAFHANAGDGAAYPSIRTVARNIRRSGGTVMDALEALAAGGLTSAQGRLRQAGRRGRRPMIWTINPPPSSAEALEAVARAIHAHRAAVRVRKGREIVRPGRTNRGVRDRRGRFSISPSPTDEKAPILSVPHGVASFTVGDGQNSRNSGPEAGTVRRPPVDGAGLPPSHGTAAKEVERTAGRAARRAARDPLRIPRPPIRTPGGPRRAGDAAKLVAEVADLLLRAPVADQGRLLTEFEAHGLYPDRILAEGKALAAQLRPVSPLARTDGASSPGSRVPSETSGPGSRGERRGPLSRCIIAVEPARGESAFVSPSVLSEPAKAGIWTPAPRPAFLRDVPPSHIRFAAPEEAERPVRRGAR